MTMADGTNRFPKITEEGLADLRRRIGVPITDTVEPWNYEATRDGIRHYAHGIGDDNPMECDPTYAAKTKYGTVGALNRNSGVKDKRATESVAHGGRPQIKNKNRRTS